MGPQRSIRVGCARIDAACPIPPYEKATGEVDIFQGEILPDCPWPVVLDEYIDTSQLPALPLENEFIDVSQLPALSIEVGVHKAAIILSQSCDLQPREEDKIQSVLLCPATPLEEWKRENNAGKGRINQLFGYRIVGYYPLPKLPDKMFFNDDYLVADFRQLFVLPIKLVRGLVAKLNEREVMRLRLRPPHREHFSHALGEFFSRPALPDDPVHL